MRRGIRGRDGEKDEDEGGRGAKNQEKRGGIKNMMKSRPGGGREDIKEEIFKEE